MRLQYRLQAAFPRHRSNKFCSGLQCSFHTAHLLSACSAEVESGAGKRWHAALHGVKNGLITFHAYFADAENGKELPSGVICICFHLVNKSCSLLSS